jgi:hypothetical protein
MVLRVVVAVFIMVMVVIVLAIVVRMTGAVSVVVEASHG